MYIIMVCFLVIFGFYMVSYTLFLISFLLLVPNLEHLDFLKAVNLRPRTQKLLFIFFAALFLRYLLLFQDQVITRDVEVYALRARYMMGGQMPYSDFAVNKPPLYAYLIYSLGLTLGPGALQFRAVFSFLDACLTVMLFLLCTCRYGEKFSLKASFAYAICPLPIVTIGLSGHYEPVVLIPILLSLYFLFKNKYELSALFLGIGFAFKFFPVVLLPFFAWKAGSWKERIIYCIFFLIPFGLSILPMLIWAPEAFMAYMYDQSVAWPAKKSIAHSLELILGTRSILGISISLFTQAFFLGMIAVMFLTWIKKRFDPSFWFKIIVLTFVAYYGLFIAGSIIFYSADLGIRKPTLFVILFLLLYILCTSPFVYRFVTEFSFKMKTREEMFVLTAFALIFMLFSSNQYNAWYILWFLPFVLAIKNWYVRMILLWLMFWSYEGIGISLLPGLALA
jgi:hypothetical protein